MNFCELELAKTVQRSGNVETVAKELYQADSTKSIDEIISYLNTIVETLRTQGGVFSPLGFQEFFRVNGKIDNLTYVKVRQLIQQKISDSIFGNIPALSDARLNNNMNTLKRNALKSLSDSSLKLHYQYAYQKGQFINEQNAESIANYLIAYHLPTAVQAIARDLIKFDNNRFVFNIKTKVRTDWNSDQYDDKPAELNSSVKMILGVTPMLDQEGETVGTFKLTTNSFFFAISELFEDLEKDFVSNLNNDDLLDKSSMWYQKIMDNPIELINYFLSSDFDAYLESNSTLSGNILRSFVHKWIKRGGTITPFAQNCLISSESSFYNPLHLIITSAIKNTSNTFIDREYTPVYTYVTKKKGNNEVRIPKLSRINAKNISLDKRRSLLAASGSQAIESITKEDLQAILPANIEDLTADHIRKVLHKLFPYQVISLSDTDSRMDQWKNNFKIFYNFINGKHSSLKTIVEEKTEGQTDSSAECYYWIVRNALNTNPYLIKGTQSNNLDSQVPVYGLRTVANSIPLCIANLRTAVIKKNSIYEKLGLTHVSPYEHSALYKGTIPIPKTVYNSSFLWKSGKNDHPIKEYRDLTAKEMAHLSICYDYLESGNIMRIQPITVSDKTRVPFFEFDKTFVKQGKSNSELLSEIEMLYKQSIINTLNDFNLIFNGAQLFTSAEISWGEIKTAINNINSYLQTNNITKKGLWTAAQDYNKRNGTNITFAEHLDFSVNKETKVMSVSTSATLYTDAIMSNDFWKKQFFNFINNLYTVCPEIEIKGKDLKTEIESLIRDIESDNEMYKESELYNYFVLHNYMTENILANTVGLPMSHKGSGNSWEKFDSKANLTMVKRMVALTATMHPCTKGILSGLPNEINTQTVDLGKVEMYTYSGSTAAGNGFADKLDVSDGIIFGTRAGDNLLKASIGDVRPKGNMLKLLHHDFDPTKGYARLVKCAEMSVDNAMIRTWDIHPEDEAELKAFSPKNFMKMCFQNAELSLDSFGETETGEFVLCDYSGNELSLKSHKKINGEVYTLNGILYNPESKKVELEYYSESGNVEYTECDLNLYSIWEGLGGAFSCDSNGNFNEGSQDALSTLLNRVGFAHTDTVQSQADVDQYLKQQVTFYIHTASAQKSLQPPTSTLQESLAGKGFDIKMSIDRLGIQLDADHSAEDSHIREISQLMSNLAEGGYVSEKAEKVYARIQSLVQTSLNDLHIDTFKLSQMSEYDQKQIHDYLGKKFSQIFKRAMSDPNADIMGLANAIAVELQHKNILVPISDRQHLSKYHTTVGSYFNKFIARAWTGRADVLMPGNDMLMIYEDLDGSTYMPGDINHETGLSIRDHIRDRMFNPDGSIKQSFIETHQVKKHAVHPNTNYYIIENGNRILYQTNTYNDLIELSNRIELGAIVVPAYNLPRNLKAKQVGVVITTIKNGETVNEYHDIYFFNTHRKIANCGNLLSRLSGLNDKTITEKDKLDFLNISGQVFVDIESAKNKLTELKKSYGNALQGILTSLSTVDFNNPDSVNKVMGTLESELNIPIAEENELRTFKLHTELDERITSNNYSHIWGNTSFSEIAQKKNKYFESRLRSILEINADHNNILTEEGIQSAVILFTMQNKSTCCVSNPDHIKDGALEIPVIVDEEGYRLDDNNRRLYLWPEGARLFQKNGHDIILTNNLEENIKTITNNSYFIGYRSEQDYFLPINYYGSFNNNSKEFETYIQGLSMAQYQSWLKTNHCVQARIPSQSLSFAMHLKTVGYCPWATNISICSNAHVFTQGSDFDIDKIYAMMYSVSGSGVIKQSEEYTFQTVNSEVDNLSSEDKTINTLIGTHLGKALLAQLNHAMPGEVWITNADEITRLYSEISRYLIGVGKLSGSTITLSKTYILATALQLAKIDYRTIQRNGLTVGDQLLSWINTLNKSLNKHAQVLQDQKADQYGGLQNNTLDQMIDIFDDARILLPQTTPTTMFPINSVVEDRDLEGSLRNHLDPSSVWFVNQTAMVGKDGVGITASAQKAMLALTQYNSMRKNENFAKPIVLELPEAWQKYKHNGKFVKTEFFINFVLPGQKLNKPTLEAIFNWASNWKIGEGENTKYPLKVRWSNDSQDSIKISGAQFGTEEITLGIGTTIDSELATTINSAFISSATDNAKEMKLDLIGGHPLLLPSFMYGLTLGMPVDLLVSIFTDPEVKDWILKARGNIFVGGGTSVRLKNKLSDFKPKDQRKQKVLSSLIKGGEALTTLARKLSINQGMKVNVGEVQNWFLKIQTDIDNVIPEYLDKPSDGYKRFDAYEFFTMLPDIKSRREYAKLREDSDLAFNILDVFATVPHYYAMCQVPLVFKEVMENQSTDIRMLHKTMATDYYRNRFVDTKNISNYLRSINHLKIFEFLRSINWTYSTDSVYKGSRLSDDITEETTLSTSEATGIYSLKKFIEESVIHPMQEQNLTNAFLANIQRITKLIPIVSKTVKALGISFNMTHPQNKDMADVVRLGFYEIQDTMIEGHTFGEWMFIYDLIVNHHDVGNNSFTNVFDQMIDFNDEGNIITQYVKFIHKHDDPTVHPYSSETSALIPTKNNEDSDDEYRGIKTYCSGEVLPIRIDVETRTGENSYISASALQRYFNDGNLLIFTC